MWWLLLCLSLSWASDIRDYLLSHPEVVAQALEKHQENVRIENIKTVLLDLDSQIVIDHPKGENTLVMFVDYRCGACRRVYPWVERFVDAHPEIKFTIKPYPVLGTESMQAALMMFDVSKEKAKQLHEDLIDQSYSFSKERLKELGRQYEVNVYLPSMLQRHQAFSILEKTHMHSQLLENKSVPFFIMAVEGQYQTFQGLASQAELENVYKQLSNGTD